MMVSVEYSEYETAQDWQITPDIFYAKPKYIQEKMMAFTRAKRTIESFVSDFYEAKREKESQTQTKTH